MFNFELRLSNHNSQIDAIQISELRLSTRWQKF
jgi:hypothetical protein